MIQASIYGCLGADPVERETRAGKVMVTVSLAVNAGRPDAGDERVWVSLVAFGRAAGALARHVKGDLVAAMGALYRNRYTGRDGAEREGWSLTIDAIVSARSVRPHGGRRRAQPAGQAATPATTASLDDGAPFDDPIPWGEP